MKNSILHNIFEISQKLDIPIVLLGGLALPAYNVARTTIDIDISIFVKTQGKLQDFIKELGKIGLKTIQYPKIGHDLFTIFGKSIEMEIWLKPCDAFDWDDKMVAKRIQLTDNFYVLSKEDYILTKLSRMDCSSTDLQDVIQVIINNLNEIDENYLIERLKQYDKLIQFQDLLKEIIAEVKPSQIQQLKKLQQKIISIK